ncbi:MAG: acylneuraminate cytidylyltransferase family protein [Candidatus Omnitrophica bacterium]|nr:acylneuraminate cytidylyltransferase family protein [Candidatus Omnitrophota bacterium]
MKRICTICARGGSKGLKNKNIMLIQGKPLIAHTLQQAKDSKLFDAVVVSSDSDDILKVSREWGADYFLKRPEEMATDTASKLPAIRHAVLEIEKIKKYAYETIVDLDATSPLRTIQDIHHAVRLFDSRKVSNVITAARSRHSPYFNLVENNSEGFVRLSKNTPTPVVRRQDSPACYDMNASIYVWKRNRFIENPAIFYSDTLLYEMPPERSVDIDHDLDFEVVKLLMDRQHQNQGNYHEF